MIRLGYTMKSTHFVVTCHAPYYYLRRRLASEGIASPGVTLCVCLCVRRAAYITYRLHAVLVLAAKVMRCIQCSLVAVVVVVVVVVVGFSLNLLL